MKTYFQKSNLPQAINGIIEIAMSDEHYVQLKGTLLDENSKEVLVYKETKAKAQSDALVEARKNREVPRYAGRAALIKASLMPKLLEAIELIKDVKEKLLVENEINERPNWKRSSAFLNGFAKKLGLTDKQVDDLFDAAEKEI